MSWPPNEWRRREFLGHLGGAVVGLIGAQSAALGNACGRAQADQRPAPIQPTAGTGPSGTFVPDIEVALRASRSSVQLLPGPTSEVWTFSGRVLRGAASALQNVESGALGPTFHVHRGQKLRILFDNEISEPSIVHWHGLTVPAVMDGHPRFAIRPGQRYVYEFEVRNSAGTYWYHAHPDMRTGPQVYRGMLGLFLVHDPDEDRLPLPRDAFDIPLVIQDRVFDSDNQLFYAPSPMDAMNGWLGNRVLVNGVDRYMRRVATRAYRLRVLNASNSRIYRLAWADGMPLNVIATDGGLLERPVQRQYLMLGPAERVELWVDLSDRAMGSELALVSLEFDAGASGMGMGMGPMRATARQGTPLTILTLRVDTKSNDRSPLPSTLVPFERYRRADAVNVAAPRRVVPTMDHMSWGMNGRSFHLEEIAPDEHAKLGTLEVWEFDNASTGMSAPIGGPGNRGMRTGMRGMGMGMMGMNMPHPMHLHGGSFQVLDREGATHSGYVDDGWKDTVLLMPGERARILMRYRDYAGLFLYHCHNLEHEDGGMMRNLSVDA